MSCGFKSNYLEYVADQITIIKLIAFICRLGTQLSSLWIMKFWKIFLNWLTFSFQKKTKFRIFYFGQFNLILALKKYKIYD